MIQVLVTAASETEAEMIRVRLADAGIRAFAKRNIGADLPQLGAGGARDVYVAQEDLARGRELLQTQAFTDEELTELSLRSVAEPAEDPPPA
jgi:hypothetical protein